MFDLPESPEEMAAIEAACPELPEWYDDKNPRMAFLAGWLAGREWQRGRAAGYVFGQRVKSGEIHERVGARIVARGSVEDADSYRRGMAFGYQKGRE